MATPISNDKILPSDNTRTSASERKTTENGGSSNLTTGSEVSDQDKTAAEAGSVDVERANQVYSQSQPQTSSEENAITTSEQAQSVLAKLRDQIAQNGVQALKAHAGSASTNLSALLEAAPA